MALGLKVEDPSKQINFTLTGLLIGKLKKLNHNIYLWNQI